MSYTYPHISVKDTTTQAIAVADTPQVITFDTTNIVDKITVTTSSRFTINESGGYIVGLTAQITTTTANKTLDLWFRVNGSDVANSNTKRILKSNGDVDLTSISGLEVGLTAGDYIEVWASGDSTALSLKAYAAGTTPTRPVTPSITMSIFKVHP